MVLNGMLPVERVRPAGPGEGLGELVDRVRRAIEGVAGSRVRELGVAWEDGSLILTGQSPSQHVKQLVQESAMGSLDRRIALVNRIRVRS